MSTDRTRTTHRRSLPRTFRTRVRGGLLLGFAFASIFVACRSDAPAPGERSPGKPTTLHAASQSGPGAPASWTRDHDVHGAAMRDAIVRADLDAAKREARTLADFALEMAESPWRTNVHAMLAALDRVTQAADLENASRAMASVARICGDCHAAAHIVGFRLTGTAPPGGSVSTRMAHHAWASLRLWLALIGPSDEAWKSGISALESAPVVPESFTPGQSPVPEIGQLTRRVRQLAGEGRTAESAAEREEIYGRLMTTCATCHRRVGGGPGVGG